MPRKLVVGGMEIGFKYSRCHSTEHVVNDCPQVRNRAPNAWRWGGTTPVLPPPPVPPVQEDPKPAKTADRADLAETPTSGNGSPELFSATAISTAADVSQQKKWWLLLPRQNGKSPLTATLRTTRQKKGNLRIPSRPTLDQRTPPLLRRQRIRATNSLSLRCKSQDGREAN